MHKTPFLITGAALLAALTGCISSSHSGQPASYRGPSVSRIPAFTMLQDDYDYYPSYGIYYSHARREYIYRDSGGWVREREPRGVSLDALATAPSVRMDFHDSPEYHHETVLRSYPGNWRR